eukprot:4123230-Pyramimonas_sp.AAC.1
MAGGLRAVTAASAKSGRSVSARRRGAVRSRHWRGHLARPRGQAPPSASGGSTRRRASPPRLAARPGRACTRCL